MAASTERSAIWHWNVVRLGLGLLGAIVGVFVAYESLHVFFVLAAALMVVLALAALFQSLRSALGDPTAGVGLRATLPERAALLDEKNALLRAIKDIAYEHEVGKLSDADFERLDRAYRRRAKEVLRKLDEDLAPFLERAEKLVGAELGPAAPSAPKGKKKKKRKIPDARRECPSCGTSNAADAVHCKECGARIEPRVCPACATSNDADAKFCKKCAAPLADGAAAEGRRGAKREDASESRDGASGDAAGGTEASDADAGGTETGATTDGTERDEAESAADEPARGEGSP